MLSSQPVVYMRMLTCALSKKRRWSYCVQAWKLQGWIWHCRRLLQRICHPQEFGKGHMVACKKWQWVTLEGNKVKLSLVTGVCTVLVEMQKCLYSACYWVSLMGRSTNMM